MILRILPAVLLTASISGCGGIVERQGTGNDPAPSKSASPNAPTNPASSASASPIATSQPAPVPTAPTTPPSQGDGVACWSPGPGSSDGRSADGGAPISNAQCSPVGTWDYSASAGATGSLSFDAYGNWVGGAQGADLCADNTMYGTYTLDGSDFWLVTIHDASVCGGDWGRSYTATFDASCTSANFTEVYDNCTGARTEFNYDLVLEKR